jgi:hypothetical protein
MVVWYCRQIHQEAVVELEKLQEQISFITVDHSLSRSRKWQGRGVMPNEDEVPPNNE